jgi:purine-cytosine permease-like protein
MTTPPSELRDSQSDSVLPPPQFGLRALLWVITGCAVIFALSRWLSPIALAGVVMLVLSVIAHVAGNAIGTRLRELGGRRKPKTFDQEAASSSSSRPAAADFAPVTRLGQRQSLGWPIIIGTASGTVAGGIGGGLWTIFNAHGSPDPLSLVVGVLAFAVLNGIGAFVIFGFIQVGLGAIRQALAHASHSDESP